MYLEYARVRIYPAAITLTSVFGSLFSPVYAADPPHPQEFVVTAYYSPLPNQCCYFRGSYEEEIAFNGNGIRGADGTGVYPGMLAAPPTYDFGVMIDLPGFGVGTVHDRGGRIIEWGDDLHRIDVWMGTGEEGLARAMEWGVRRVSGTVYPLGTEEMPQENFTLANVSANTKNLASLPKTDPITILPLAEFGNQDYSVQVLQKVLKDLGYFDAAANGQFGPVTKQALTEFLADYALSGDGTKVTPRTAAALMAAQSIGPGNLPDLTLGLEKGASGADVRQAQKLLRYLGFYRGRTNGVFDDALKNAVMAFQFRVGLVHADTDPGAGRIGPGTKAAVLKAWKAKVVAGKSEALAARQSVIATVKEKSVPAKVLSDGDRGQDVKRLQSFLVDAGYLPAKDITGTFGARTKKALLAFQLDRKIVDSSTAKGAGVFGPATKLVVAGEAVDTTWKKIRADGLESL